jgi:hypothetical protein
MSVSVSIKPDEKVSRVEVLIRILYCIVIYIVSIFVGIALYILLIVNVLTCLILAKRIAPGFTAKVIEWYTSVGAYLLFVTDERPSFIPKF